jgi:hypothetical protein
MPKGRNHWVARIVRPYYADFLRENGRAPRPIEVVRAHPELQGHYEAVRRNCKRYSTKGPDEIAPPVSAVEVREKSRERGPTIERIEKSRGSSWLETRINNIRSLIEVLEERGREGVIDAQAIDKLVRLERQLVTWKNQDAVAATRKGSEGEDNPTWSSMLKRFSEREKRREGGGVHRFEIEPIPRD